MNKYLKALIALFVALAAVAAGTITYVVLTGGGGTGGRFLSSFYTEESLREFLKDSAIDVSQGGLGDERYSLGTPTELAPKNSEASIPHSSTNVQVAGIDEEDMVKTDGEYIYISGWNGVSVLRAYPPLELANASHIDEKDVIGPGSDDVNVWIKGLYLASKKLVIISEVSSAYYRWVEQLSLNNTDVIWEGPRTMVSVFDVSDAENPTFEFSYGVSGYPLTSRMIDGRVYLIAQSYTWIYQGDLAIPKLWTGSDSREFRLSNIYYDPETTEANSFLNLLAVDVEAREAKYMSIVAGYASTIYMSYNALYLTIQKWTGGWITLDSERTPGDEDSTLTTIYKISVNGLSMETTARGEVKGWLLNQFSMDEKDSLLRVATTTSWIEPKNNVYVLDENLDTIGELKGLAPTERIYAARFVGDVLYLVTFRQVDPLFVIDLSLPGDPKVVGELHMPGFCSYLHPVDDDHVLGIGSENWSLKIALYDVSDPANPVEESKFVTSDSSWSLAMHDHKAVLFDLEKELLVIPASSWGWDEFGGSTYKAGAFVFRVSFAEGISLRGIVEHESTSTWWHDCVERSLYIGDYLYTVSDYLVKASSLEDLSEISSVWYNVPPRQEAITV
ncbi:MAG: beta-propeller domain-containing protein [Thermoplasmata archaeon]